VCFSGVLYDVFIFTGESQGPDPEASALDSPSELGELFEVVGDAYMPGLMDGEAFPWMGQDPFREFEFDLNLMQLSMESIYPSNRI
jgi:hypothetical protein